MNLRIEKSFRKNLEVRDSLWREGYADVSVRRAILKACSEDILFWVNYFVWTYDPREETACLPFVTYGFQDEALFAMRSALVGSRQERQRVVLEKSRDMGATWMCALLFLHSWLFEEDVSYLCLSRKEEYVDSTDNPDCIFAKFDFVLARIPTWMLPKGFNRRDHRSRMKLYNPQTRSVINGESTNGDAGRGGRRTAIWCDEFAFVDEQQAGQGNKILRATGNATRCQIFNSTPNGTGNAFYLVRTNPNNTLVTMHWSKHPNKNRGLYTCKDGKLVVLDKDYEFPQDYPFNLTEDGKLRSPWYDNECSGASPVEIAQELDIDYLASGSPFFSPSVLAYQSDQYARNPVAVGRLCNGVFVDNATGELTLWCNLPDGKPPQDTSYVMGVDVSSGMGSSDSVCAVYDAITGQKVGEWVHNKTMPEAFGRVIADLARFFSTSVGTCFVVPEATGPGGATIKTLYSECGYDNIYRMKQDNDRKAKRTGKLGWYSTKQGKMNVLTEYRKAMASGDIQQCSQKSLDQCAEYVFTPDGGVEHSGARASTDGSGNKMQHGDRVIADALAVKGITEISRAVVVEKPKPVNCIGSRMEERRRNRANENLDWYELAV